MSKCVWIISGETSGDIYGAKICKSLNEHYPDTTVRAMGGPELKAAGADIMVDSTELGVMGIVEVLKMYPLFKRIFDGLVKRAEEERPDAVILIDYPGFNVRLAKKLHPLGIKVIYYVSPQVWAWGKKRIPVLKKIVDCMIVIFPFEVDFWKKKNYQAHFAGHPLIEILGEEKIDEERDPNTFVLLPGSRRTELNALLKPMLQTSERLLEQKPELKFVIPAARPSLIPIIESFLVDNPNRDKYTIADGQSTYWIQKAGSGLASSGTVTIQAAILGLPLISIYHVNPITFFMVKRLVKLDYFTMVNIIANKEIYHEFLQGDVNPDVLTPECLKILPGGERHQEVCEDLESMVKQLGQGTDIFKKTAKLIADCAKL